MNTRFGLASRMLPLILMSGLVAGCGQGGRQAAEATTEAISAGSPSAESSSVGAFVDGSRICIINKSSKNFQIEPLVYKEKSNSTSVDPGNDYCQAGYVEGDDDTALRAISGPTKLHITAVNPQFSAAEATVKFVDDRGSYERTVVTNLSDIGVHKKGNTPDERFGLDLYRVDDCCGWKQWRLEIVDPPTG